MNALLRIAVALLPTPMRERYREQWAADVRDATEAGLSPSSIAWGALRFAVTAPRPWPAVSFDPSRARRVAFALALASAIVGLTAYPGFGWGTSIPAPAYQPAVAIASTVVLAVQVFGPLMALALVSRPGATPAERISVMLLVAAAGAPVVESLIPSEAGATYGDMYVYPGAVVFVCAVVMIIIALALRPRDARPGSRPSAIAVSTGVVATGGVAAYVTAVAPWFERPPRDLSTLVRTPLLRIALEFEAAFEATVTNVLVFAAVVLVLVVILVPLAAAHLRLDVVTATAVLVIGYGFLLLSGFIALGAIEQSNEWLPYDALFTAYRLGSIAAVFVLIDGGLSTRPVRTAVLP
jgi:hypothetical protein